MKREPERSSVVSVHVLRRRARAEERKLTRVLRMPAVVDGEPVDVREVLGVPLWTEGFRVEKAGPFQHAVVATSWKGH